MKLKTLIILLLFLVGFTFAYQHEEKIEKTFNLGPDGLLTLSNINGPITASTHNKDVVLITAIKSCKREANLDKIEIRFIHDDNRLKVSVHKERKWRRIQFRVEFLVKIPKKLKSVSLASVNGSVKTNGIFRDLDISTVNGRVDFTGEFYDGDFHSTNGKIRICHESPLQGDVSVRTVNGGVNFELNHKSSFVVEGTTVNGSIRSEFDVDVKRRFVGSRVRGSVKDGEYRIKMKTVNGSIRLLSI